MSFPVNVAIREPLYLGSSGETLTRSYSEIAGTATTFTVTLIDLEDGNYLVTYTPTLTGRHIWNGETNSGMPVSLDWMVTAFVATPVQKL